jgi:hypothetical protein
MKVYKVELIIIDFDNLGADGIKTEIEDARYANNVCSFSAVVAIIAML